MKNPPSSGICKVLLNLPIRKPNETDTKQRFRMHNHNEGIRETMRNIFILILCFFCLGCASIVNSELELVSIKGLSSEGTHFFISPNGRTEIVGSNVFEGEEKFSYQGQEQITMQPLSAQMVKR